MGFNDSGYINKASVWLGITYPENMIDGWEQQAEEVLQGLPFAYCIHDKDKKGHVSKDNPEGDRKVHVHWMLEGRLATGGSMTRKRAVEIFNLFSKPGTKCCPGVEACINPAYAFEYLRHNTEKAQSDGKHLYSVDEVKESAAFDITRLVKISEERKQEMFVELCDLIVDRNMQDMRQFYLEVRKNWDEEYMLVYKAQNGQFDRLCRGNFNAAERRRTVLEAPKCAICGGNKLMGSYETKQGRMWFCEDCQEYAYIYLCEMEMLEKEKDET